MSKVIKTEEKLIKNKRNSWSCFYEFDGHIINIV